MRNTAVKIGELLRQRRELLGLLQPQLAAIAGVSTRTIQLIEAGKANPSLETLFNVADSLGLSIKLELKGPVKDVTSTNDQLP
jgi:y4mF family transcriptional regulator